MLIFNVQSRVCPICHYAVKHWFLVDKRKRSQQLFVSERENYNLNEIERSEK